MHDHEPGPRPAEGVSSAVAGEALQRDLYVRHRGWMLRYAMAIVKNADTAEDLVEQVFLNALHADASLARITEQYLRTAVRNACRHELQWKNRFTPIPPGLLDGNDRAARIDAAVELDRLLSLLPPDCARVVRARLAGSRNSEIAAQLGVSETLVRAQYHRALVLLRRYVRSPPIQPTILRRNASNTKMVVAGPGAGRLQTSERSGSE
jgi:RNA polymerase sigma factor (sigma-70 family)